MSGESKVRKGTSLIENLSYEDEFNKEEKPQQP